MRLYHTTTGLVAEDSSRRRRIETLRWNEIFRAEEPAALVHAHFENGTPITCVDDDPHGLLAPIDAQEVWASGVTYFRSRVARMEESESAGGGDFYAKVYDADRPEIFFKTTAHRVSGPHRPIRIRRDSTWDVPEPELAVAVTSHGRAFGYTVGNDVSSRSIEGENPLYLPQAKTYDACCALGPCLVFRDTPLPADASIRLAITRDGDIAFDGSTTIGQMKRSIGELVGFLTRETTFPDGCWLLTGTGIIPDAPFTLQPGDVVSITIDGIGTLTNPVTREAGQPGTTGP